MKSLKSSKKITFVILSLISQLFSSIFKRFSNFLENKSLEIAFKAATSLVHLISSNSKHHLNIKKHLLLPYFSNSSTYLCLNWKKSFKVQKKRQPKIKSFMKKNEASSMSWFSSLNPGNRKNNITNSRSSHLVKLLKVFLTKKTFRHCSKRV